jgi:hypothetical protein
LLTFKRADGLTICPSCGAIYSDILPKCPGCKNTYIEINDPKIRYICIEDDPCPEGGADGPCCVSCDRYSLCNRVCQTAKEYNGQPDEGAILCEFMKQVDSGSITEDIEKMEVEEPL